MTRQPRQYNVEESKAFVQTLTIEPTGPGPLGGLNFAVKDLIDLGGYKTSCGNPSWRDTHPPAAANAVCVDQLLAAGARCIGKTITDELAFGLDGENFFFGTPLNPRASDRVPGGSSSGSASAVACGLADFALGTDTGGSVRVPAGNCGIFGMRPTHGLISVAGVNPFAPTFDTVGVLARSAGVLARVVSVLESREVPSTAEVATIHVIEEAFALADNKVVKALAGPLDTLRTIFPGKVTRTNLSDIHEEFSSSGLRGWYDIYCRIQWAEIWSCLGSWVEQAKPQFGPRVKVNFELVKNIDRTVSVDALRRREDFYMFLKEFLGPHDLLCIPTSPALAPLKGSLGNDRTSCDYYPRALSLTAIAGIGRLPQVTLPLLADVDGVPVGLSLLASQGMDMFLLAVAQMIAKES